MSAAIGVCPTCHELGDICPLCEREAEDRAEHRAEERCRTWTERGERWAEAVVYGETR